MNTEVAAFNGVTDLIMEPGRMGAMTQFAELMASSKEMVPKHYRDEPSACMAVTMQAMRWGMDPFAVAQKTHIVSGNLGYESQLVNAVVSSSTAIDGRFHYEYGGDWGQNDGKSADKMRWVKVGAKLRGEPDIQWGEPLYPASVTTKNSPLWKTNEKQQSSYLAVKMWARLYTPAVILGVYTSDELQDITPAERDITPPKESALRRPAKDEQPEAIEAENVSIDQDQNAELMPVDDLIKAMNACKTMEQLDIAATPGGQYPKGCPEWKQSAKAYKAARSVILRAIDEAELAAK